MEQVSADFVLSLNRRFDREHHHAGDKGAGALHQVQDQVRGGGGLQRAIVSDHLRNNLAGKVGVERKAVFQRANQRYDEIVRQGGEELQKFEDIGKAGTRTHRGGGPAFGLAPCKVRQRQQRDVRAALSGVEALQALAAGDGEADHRDLPLVAAAHVQAVSVERLEAIASEHKEALVAMRTREDLAASSAASWSSSMTEAFIENLPEPLKKIAKFGGKVIDSTVAVADARGEHTTLAWAPPCRDLSFRALNAVQSRQHPDLLKDLRSEWGEMHDLVEHEKVPQLGKVKPIRPTTCWRAGFCLHNRAGLTHLETEFPPTLASTSLQPMLFFDTGDASLVDSPHGDRSV